jgi:hypothetical protein
VEQKGNPLRRQTIIVLGVALLLFVAVGASAQLVNPSGDDMLNDHEQRITALEAEVFGTDSTTTTQPDNTTTTQPDDTTTTQPEDSSAPPEPAGTATTTTTTTTPPEEATPTPTVPGGDQHILIDKDTLITDETLVLRPGDTIEFRNGARLSFGEGAAADWQGTPTSTWSDLGTKQNLDRDIEIYGEGEIRFERGSGKSVIRFVEIDLQPIVETGRYPLHWHHAMDGSRGTLVEGVVIKNSTNRAYVPHASHGITIRDSIASNIQGIPFWWDSPGNPTGSDRRNLANNTHGSVWDHNLVDGAVPHALDGAIRFAGFELGAGENNTVRNSVARDIGGRRDCSGFTWPELHVSQPTTWTFDDNVTIDSNCHGIFTWQNNGNEHIVNGFRSVGERGECISHGAYGNRFDYRNIQCESVRVHALGWSITGGRAGDVIVNRHKIVTDSPVTFTDVEVDSLTIINGSNQGENPGNYVFNNTGLTFDQVAATDVVPGTTVTIDGETRRYG